jgi:catechol 2,3-dioxygenase-like lactoylglutathione lyase family enzyme
MNANRQRRFVSCTSLDEIKANAPEKVVPCANGNWTLSDAVEVLPVPPTICIKAFNHVSREVVSLEKSKQFYVDILGFQVIPRPPFDCDGYWLYGHGLNLHLVASKNPNERMKMKLQRIQHFSAALPRVDHIAFLTEDVTSVEAVLDHYDVYYKHELPKNTRIEQLFLFDPDGNVIEISNCAPDHHHENPEIFPTENFHGLSPPTTHTGPAPFQFFIFLFIIYFY